MIQLDGVRAGYDGEEKLHGLSCELPEGKLIALIGPNGCGKSTLLKAMAGLLPMTGGTILLGGEDLKKISRSEVARLVSYMPQSRPVPEITVRQLVSHGRYPHLQWGRRMTKEDHEIVEEALRQTDTLAYASRSVAQLSGGERQRVYVAMMLAQQTKLLLLDEPTTYLDLGAQFMLMDLLVRLKEKGHAMVVVLHDLSLALSYADEILLMQEGNLAAQGLPEDVCGSGKLAEVFGVKVERIAGDKYLFSKRTE